MSAERVTEVDARTMAAMDELEALISSRYPTASYQRSHGEDPEGQYLTATVDIDDTDDVVDLVIDRLLEMQVEEGLPVYVIPLRRRRRALAAVGELGTRGERV